MVQLPNIPISPEHGAPARIQLKLSGLKDMKRCLLVGNSMTHFNYMPYMLEMLLHRATQDPWACSSITRGGATLGWHRETNYAGETLASSPPFEVVVFQDQSRRPAQFPKESAEDFIFWTRKAQETGARVVLYQTWNLRDEAPQQDAFQKTLGGVGKQTGAEIAPVGLVWERLRERFPPETLYRPDGKHPTALGSLIAAACLCHTLCGKLPRKCPSDLLAGGYEELKRPNGFWETLKDHLLNQDL